MIEVVRFSMDGFEPKVQSYHLRLFTQQLSRTPESIAESAVNDYQRQLLLKSFTNWQREERENIHRFRLCDWHKGVFIFRGEPDDRTKDFYLNHLTGKELKRLDLFRKFLPPETEVYQDWGVIPLRTSLESIPNGHACYLPQVRLYN